MQMSSRIEFSLTKTSLLLAGSCRYSHVHGIPRFPNQSVWLSLYFLGKFKIAQSCTNSPDDLFSASNTLVYARRILVIRAQNVRKEGLLTKKKKGFRLDLVYFRQTMTCVLKPPAKNIQVQRINFWVKKRTE